MSIVADDIITYRNVLSPDGALFHFEILNAALAYAANGYPVFPAAIIKGKKQPLVKIGSGTAHGMLASTDPSQITEWWTRWPIAMIGMPTGKITGIIVIDVDIKNGVDGLQELYKKFGPPGIEATTQTDLICQTPSGGYHFYFQYSSRTVLCSVGRIAPGVDVRGDGGVIILPPSRPGLYAPDYAFADGFQRPMGELL